MKIDIAEQQDFAHRQLLIAERHLKITLPEPVVTQSVCSGLEKLFAAFCGDGKG